MNNNESPFGEVIYAYSRSQAVADRVVKLIAICGALDVDDPQPAITILLPDED